jgi:hypothetical protein
VLEEAGVRDNAVEESAVDVEEMDTMPLRASANCCQQWLARARPWRLTWQRQAHVHEH